MSVFMKVNKWIFWNPPDWVLWKSVQNFPGDPVEKTNKQMDRGWKRNLLGRGNDWDFKLSILIHCFLAV